VGKESQCRINLRDHAISQAAAPLDVINNFVRITTIDTTYRILVSSGGINPINQLKLSSSSSSSSSSITGRGLIAVPRGPATRAVFF
jgi:hypothetical protein